MSALCTVSDTNAMIAEGQVLLIAGDEAALSQLRRGAWIAGTIPYFLTSAGGCVDRDNLLVTAMPADITAVDIRFVDPDRLEDLPRAAFDNGFSIVVIPGMSEAHAQYATRIQDVAGLFEKPIAGWIAGVQLEDLGRVKPKVFFGQTGEVSTDRIVVLHTELPPSVVPRIGIINLFEQGSGDCIRFGETGFTADACNINGEPASFFDYMRDRQLDQRMPLVADLSGEMVNVSFQAIDAANHCVRFYAPVQGGIEYRQTAPLKDYRQQLMAHLATNPVQPVFACNCILNYLYAGLEGDQPIAIGGPATFGEIAYILLNQTLVYLVLDRPDA